MKRTDPWVIAETLGLPVKDIGWIQFNPNDIVVKRMLRNDDGYFYIVVDPTTHERDAAAEYLTFPYDNVSVLRPDLQKEDDDA